MILDPSKAFFACPRPGGSKMSAPYHPMLAAIRGNAASGIYAIVQDGRVLYVGESHTGRLYDTITRHFRKWEIDPTNDAQGRRRGGVPYNRHKVRVAYVVTEPDTAQALQYAEIERLKPRDNSIDGTRVDFIGAELPENPPRDENEHRGRAAMRRVLRDHADVLDAMERPGLGPVAFLWSVLGRRGSLKGIKAIEARGGARLAMYVPVVVARGTETPIPDSHRPHRINIEFRGRTVVLSRHLHGKWPAWVLTAWKDGTPDARQ